MLSALCLVCTLGSHAVATSDVTIVGRHRVTPNATLFDFQGVRITASLNGSEAQALMFQAGNGPANHFIVTVDGVRVGDGPLSFTTAEWPRGEASVVTVPLFSRLSAGVHEVVIEKTSEPAFNTRDVAPDYVGFVGFTGASTVSVPRLRSSRRVEFLGDSITAGFCNLCDSAASAPTSFPCSSRSRFRAPHVRYDVAYESFALSWANLACVQLGAECHTAAWSGFGMVRNCCGGQTLMSDVWKRTLATVPSSNSSDPHATTPENEWDFRSWRPDAVVIHLGTNDYLRSTTPELVSSFNATYLELVLAAHEAYSMGEDSIGPTFFLACGLMSSDYCPKVEWIIDQVGLRGVHAVLLNQGGKRLVNQTGRLVNQTGFACSCCGHPGSVAHAAMADAAVALIRSTMHWTDDRAEGNRPQQANPKLVVRGGH